MPPRCLRDLAWAIYGARAGGDQRVPLRQVRQSEVEDILVAQQLVDLRGDTGRYARDMGEIASYSSAGNTPTSGRETVSCRPFRAPREDEGYEDSATQRNTVEDS